jgi:hypothetical protein
LAFQISVIHSHYTQEISNTVQFGIEVESVLPVPSKDTRHFRSLFPTLHTYLELYGSNSKITIGSLSESFLQSDESNNSKSLFDILSALTKASVSARCFGFVAATGSLPSTSTYSGISSGPVITSDSDKDLLLLMRRLFLFHLDRSLLCPLRFTAVSYASLAATLSVAEISGLTIALDTSTLNEDDQSAMSKESLANPALGSRRIFSQPVDKMLIQLPEDFFSTTSYVSEAEICFDNQGIANNGLTLVSSSSDSVGLVQETKIIMTYSNEDTDVIEDGDGSVAVDRHGDLIKMQKLLGCTSDELDVALISKNGENFEAKASVIRNKSGGSSEYISYTSPRNGSLRNADLLSAAIEQSSAFSVGSLAPIRRSSYTSEAKSSYVTTENIKQIESVRSPTSTSKS